MVENDDLFERGYQTLTQNMPSKPVEKVQVLKNYSKNKLLKNVENSESIALNLTLKEDAKGKWFGNLLLAATSYDEDMRQGKINVMNFSKRKKIYLLANANNLGLNEMSGVEYLINPDTSTNSENVGTNISTIAAVNLHQKNYAFGDNRTNFNNDQLVSLNYIYNFPKDWKLKTVAIFNEIENNNYINSYYRYNYGGQNFSNTSDNHWQQNNRNIVGKLEISKDFGPNSSLQWYNKWASQKENNNNLFLFNGQNNHQNGENTLFANENRLTYTKKLDSSRVLVAVARYLYQDRPYNFTDENDVFVALLGNPNARHINQKIQSKLNFAGAKVSYLKRFAEDHNLEWQLGNEFRKEKLYSDLSVQDNQGLPIYFDASSFTNRTDFLQNTLFTKAKYNRKLKKWGYELNFLGEFIHSDLNQNKNDGFYISPGFSINYGHFRSGTISLSANKKFSPLGINQYYQNYLYQGNRNFRSNPIDYTVLSNLDIGLSYNLGDNFSKNFMLGFNYTKNDNFLSSNLIINPEYTFVQNIVLKDLESYSANMELKRFINFIKSRISLLAFYSINNSKNSINHQPLIHSQFKIFKTGFEMKSGWLKKINYELGYEWTFNDLNSDNNNSRYTNQKGFANLYYNINKELKWVTNFELYKFGTSGQKTTQFLDMKLDYIYKKFNMNVFIVANNLLNADSIQRYSIDNISESAYIQRLLPRHIVLGVNKNF